MMTHGEAIQIANTLLATNFPELGHKRIRYRFVNGKRYNFYMAVRWLVFERRIYIEQEILHFSPEAFMGCMAHEFAHIILDIEKPFFLDVWDFLKGSKNEADEERKADLLVIKRGLGNALLTFHQEHGKVYKGYHASEGLTRKEVQELVKKRK